MPESTKKDDNFRTLGIKALPVYHSTTQTGGNVDVIILSWYIT